MATDNRKKIQFYLYPEQKSQDSVAIEQFTAMPTGLRSQFYRNSILAGVALSKVDPRLIELLAAGLTDKMDKEDVITLIHSITLKGATLTPEKAPVPATDNYPAEPESAIETEQEVTPKTVQKTPTKAAKALNSDEIDSLRNNLAM